MDEQPDSTASGRKPPHAGLLEKMGQAPGWKPQQSEMDEKISVAEQVAYEADAVYIALQDKRAWNPEAATAFVLALAKGGYWRHD